MLDQFKNEFDQIINKCKEDLSAMRASRAHPSLVENILVEAYEAKMPIMQLANISLTDARSLVISVWDKTLIKNVETAITKADIGVNPVVEGTIIRINLPALTEERRKELVKTLNQKLEQYRISLRQLRDKVREAITEAEKNKEVTQDDKYQLFASLDNLMTDFNKKIKDLGDSKEEEIMRI